MAAKVSKLGPGLLTVGETVGLQDVSCQLTAARVAWSVDTDDDTVVLCGDTVPGARTYTSELTGTMFQDLSVGGFVEFSWDNKGTEQPFTFTPSSADAATVAGTVIVDPIDVGGDEAGSNMSSDFTWTIVGEPTFTAAPAALVSDFS
jgi:hypothetical protein